jgi:hypothetical protein
VLTIVKHKKEFKNRKYKSGDTKNLFITEELRSIYIEMKNLKKGIEKRKCKKRLQVGKEK